jgi:hypothetical protein
MTKPAQGSGPNFGWRKRSRRPVEGKQRVGELKLPRHACRQHITFVKPSHPESFKAILMPTGGIGYSRLVYLESLPAVSLEKTRCITPRGLFLHPAFPTARTRPRIYYVNSEP